MGEINKTYFHKLSSFTRFNGPLRDIGLSLNGSLGRVGYSRL